MTDRDAKQIGLDAAKFIDKREFVWGVPSAIPPILGLPPGRVRLRLRNKCHAMVFIKDDNGIRKFPLVKCRNFWWVDLSLEQGRNHSVYTRNVPQGIFVNG